MSRPEHYAKMLKLMEQALHPSARITEQKHRFAIEYLCNELSITDEALRLLETRVKALEGRQ